MTAISDVRTRSFLVTATMTSLAEVVKSGAYLREKERRQRVSVRICHMCEPRRVVYMLV
ncbi:hypothetical protein HanIR_Chr05g0253841 [Helianthus annuus]|nr:hypothetical protein HanIR_Chr05g0253841 [Helianthus annuus]